jgi:WD40 repeat protein
MAEYAAREGSHLDPASGRFRLAPYGPPLTGHKGPVGWGGWAQMEGRPVLATGDQDGAVRVWDPAARVAHAQRIGRTPSPVLWGSWAQGDGRLVLAAGNGGTVRVWDLDAAGALHLRTTGSFWEHPERWGGWGRVQGALLLATGLEDGTVRLWETDPRFVPAAGLDPPPTTMSDALWGAWSQVDGHSVLATGLEDGTVRLWNPHTPAARVMPTGGHTGPVLWGGWGEMYEGRPVLATGGQDGTVRLWDADAAAKGPPLTGHTGPVLWGGWGFGNERGPVLATGGQDGTVRLWDPRGAAVLGPPLTGHSGPVRWGGWGDLVARLVLATGGEDGTVRLWDPLAQEALGPPLTGHTGPVLWGGWAQMEGRPVLATGGADGAVRLWELCEERLVSLPGYRSDVGGEPDRLARGAEAAALAELITARSARPPLAIGVFGDWGEGKSHFLGQLRSQVRDRSQRVASDDELTHRAVRQVWFNAWHYAETDLWASLVAELFGQLAAPAEPGVSLAEEQRRQSRLATEVIAQRGLQERLAGARARLDDLRVLSRPEGSSWQRLSKDQQAYVAALAGSQPERLYRSLAGMGWVVNRQAQLAWAVARRIRLRWWALAALTVAAAVLIAVFAAPASRWLPALVAVAGVAASLAKPARDAWVTIRRVRATVGKWIDAQQARLDVAVNVAAQEVADLQRQLQNLIAGGQLAGLVAEQAESGTYRSRLGLMTQIRTDFERMAQLLTQASQEPATDEAGDQLPAIDRIVVYIDDLDRCPPDRVVDMLEAIHLLLALELFVVVVAVDPRWLLQALHSHYRDQLTGPADGPAMADGEQALWRPSAVQYLEKIFQVVLTLPPLASDGYVSLVDSLINPQDETSRPGAARIGDGQQVPEASPEGPAAAGPGLDDGDRTQPDGQQDDDVGPGTGIVDLPAPRVVERSDPLAFSGDEQRLLHLLGPPLIATPRAAKRLANSYGLLSALRSGDLAASQDGDQPGYRAAMVLLACLIGYPELGPDLFPHIYQRAAADPDAPWAQLVHGLQPQPEDGTWRNAARDGLDQNQAQQWQSLARALYSIEEQAGSDGVPLPCRLNSWGYWVQPVGRLSFPTGRVVSTLERHPRLPSAEPAQHGQAKREIPQVAS